MSNLPNNTTIDNNKIVLEQNSNDHTHDSSQIIGLSEDAIGDVFIYAENIDGFSYAHMQNTFVSDNNNTMTGPLSISSNSSSQNNIINVFELESIKVSNNIEDYDITSLPIHEEENTATQSIMVTGNNPSVDVSWTSSANIGIGKDNISLVGPETVESNNTYIFEITNFNSFDSYTVDISDGSVLLDNSGNITVDTPGTSSSEQVISLNITNTTTGVSKTVDMTLTEDPNMFITYSPDNVEYEQVPQSGIEIETVESFYLRLTNYNPSYNYSFSSTVSGFTFDRTDDIITVTPPLDNDVDQSGTITIDRSDGDSFDIAFNISSFDLGWDLKGFTNTVYSTFHDTTNSDNVNYTMFMNNDGTKAYIYGANDQGTYGLLERNLTEPYDISTAGTIVSTHVDTAITNNHDPRGIIVSSDGKVLTLIDGEFGDMVMLGYNTPWDFNENNRVTYITTTFLLPSEYDGEDIYPRCISMSDDGSYFHILFYDDSIGRVDLAEYDLSTNYSIGSASLTHRRNLDSNVQRLDFMTNFISNDGERMVFKRFRGSNDTYLSWYTISIPNQISSSIQVRGTEVTTAQYLDGVIYNSISSNGQNLYTIDGDNERIYQFKI